MIFLILYLLFVSIQSYEILLKMPQVRPTKEDQYICHALDLKNDTLFITGFKPKANASHAHHILIHSCAEPGSTEPYWNCEEMKKSDSKPVCKSGIKILFSWAMNASGLQLPRDVSVMIGKAVGKQYLVIQSHYKNVDYFQKPNSEPDESGIELTVQTMPTNKLAGIYLLGTDGSIPSHSTVFMETACSYTGKTALHPFAYRVHTHSLGKLVSGYVIHRKKWTEIGKKSPQEEQMFYPVNGTMKIYPGDSLAARCIMENKGDKLVRIGTTRKDEMCNFYIYYWVDRADSSQIYDEQNQMCFSEGWPSFKWDSFFDSLKIPSAAAIMPGANNIIKEIVNDMDRQEKSMEKLMSDMWNDDSEKSSDDIFDDTLFDNKKFNNYDELF